MCYLQTAATYISLNECLTGTKIYFTEVYNVFTMFCFSKNYSLVEVIHRLIRFKKAKSFLWNTKNADRIGVNE